MNPPRLLTVSAGLLALALTAGPAPAQTTYTWSGAGGDGNWSTAPNWGGTAPTSSLTGTRINLAGTTNTSTTIDAFYGGTFRTLGLTFAANAGPFVVSSAGAVLEIGAEGVVSNTGASDRTIAAPVRLGTAQKWTNQGAGHFRVTGPLDTNGFSLTLGENGIDTDLGWWIDLLGPVTGSGGVNVVGRATLRGANTYNGGTTLDRQAWLRVDSAASLGTGGVELKSSGTLTLEGVGESTMAGPLVSTTALPNQFNNLQVNAPGATLRLQPGGLQGGGDFQISGLGTTVLTGINPFSGRLISSTSGRLELIDTGGGASAAASGYSIYNGTFRVGPGAALAQAAGASQRPFIAVDGTGRAEIGQSQNLSGLTVGLTTSSPTDNPTLVTSPGVVLDLTFGLQGSHGTVNAALAGSVASGHFLHKQMNTVPGNWGTLNVGGLSTFTGRVFVEAGVLSVDSLKMTGQPSAVGAGGEIWLWRPANTSATLRYTGPSTTTDRLLQVSGIDAINSPSFLEVTDPAATLTWAGPITHSVTTGSVPRLQKTGAGTLVIASTGNSFGVPATGVGKVGVLAGTLSVTGSMEAVVTVESGATASGKLLGGNTSNYRVGVGSSTTALTAKAGATVRAGLGSSTDVLGADGVQFDAGSKFAVTVDGGAAPTASKIQRNSNGGAINFSPQATDTGRITLMLEKGSGEDFIPGQPVTVEIARGGITRRNSAFTYDASEWTPVTIGFDIVPGSFSLFTTESGNVLNARFTPVPEPGMVLAVGAVAAVLARRRSRLL